MRKLKLRTFVAATFALGLAAAAGCSDDADVAPPAETTSQAHANTRRITVDQLAGSLAVVTGQAEPWQIPDEDGLGDVNALDQKVLGATLGRPDYLQVTHEPAAVDSLYLKLSDDMARNVCNNMFATDAAQSDSDEREITRFIANDETEDSAAINENLRYLLLRFHGRNVTDDAGVSDLRAVFDGSVAAATEIPTGSTRALEGWRSVCIALLKSPAFHIY